MFGSLVDIQKTHGLLIPPLLHILHIEYHIGYLLPKVFLYQNTLWDYLPNEKFNI